MNAAPPNLITVSGIISFFKDGHSRNAFALISVIPFLQCGVG